MRRRFFTSRQRLIGITAGIIVLGLAGFYYSYRVGLHAVSDTDVTPPAVEFIVKAGQNAPAIADNLKAADLIRNRNAFITYINFHGLRAHLKTGTYSLNPSLSADQIARIIADGRTVTKRLVVPEGYRLSQIREAAATLGVSKADFNAALAAPHTQSFLATKPASVDIEGYLFPDSYQIDSDTTATSLVTAMLDTFGRRLGPEYTQAFAAQGLNLHQALTLASIVEKEVNTPADRPIVAQVFLKRLKTGTLLGSDVTVHYAADLLGVPFNLDLNSPYNTRKFVGLPPGPICSPGLGSLDAVAHPSATDYLYFLSGKDGKTYFAKTYAEHQRNIALHL